MHVGKARHVKKHAKQKIHIAGNRTVVCRGGKGVGIEDAGIERFLKMWLMLFKEGDGGLGSETSRDHHVSPPPALLAPKAIRTGHPREGWSVSRSLWREENGESTTEPSIAAQQLGASL